jgi:hypothetical protein
MKFALPDLSHLTVIEKPEEKKVDFFVIYTK